MEKVFKISKRTLHQSVCSLGDFKNTINLQVVSAKYTGKSQNIYFQFYFNMVIDLIPESIIIEGYIMEDIYNKFSKSSDGFILMCSDNGIECSSEMLCKFNYSMEKHLFPDMIEIKICK